jgi:cation diffusion facilitator CzcD-associated flavoprotein CzcO
VASKYDVKKFMQFSHRVTEARWDDLQAKWGITVENVSNGHSRIEECDIFITATGVLNLWEWPQIPGLGEFEGKLMHSAAWDKAFDPKV